MRIELNDQVAVIVGAAQGIGLAIANAFAAAGAAVAMVDLAPSVSDEAQRLQTSSSGRCLAQHADVSDYPAMQQAASRIEAEMGPVDHLVYAVGIGSGKVGFPFWNLTPEDWPRVYQVNLQGAVNTTHAFLQPMLARRRGSLLFLASVAGQIGSQTDPPYSASKAALINFAQCAAKDLAPYDIRVNTLNPGMVKTQLNRSIWAASVASLAGGERPDFETWAAGKLARVVPLNRWQEPEEIAAMALFLASGHARNITGQTINVDGGFVMHS